MIAVDASLAVFVRFAAPLVWRNDAEIARKLEEFAATEAGSALDMLKAAELTDDAYLRRVFFIHAMDEARHARMFRDLARRLDPASGRKLSETAKIHARRQNLYARLGTAAFLAFVHLAERRGEAHFRALVRHFADRPELARLFDRISREEKFHVSYSARALEVLERRGEVSASAEYRRVRLRAAWEAWRRSGRKLGDLASRAFLGAFYFAVLPVFALAQRTLEPEQTGWKTPKKRTFDPRRQF